MKHGPDLKTGSNSLNLHTPFKFDISLFSDFLLSKCNAARCSVEYFSKR